MIFSTNHFSASKNPNAYFCTFLHHSFLVTCWIQTKILSPFLSEWTLVTSIQIMSKGNKRNTTNIMSIRIIKPCSNWSLLNTCKVYRILFIILVNFVIVKIVFFFRFNLIWITLYGSDWLYYHTVNGEIAWL